MTGDYRRTLPRRNPRQQPQPLLTDARALHTPAYRSPYTAASRSPVPCSKTAPSSPVQPPPSQTRREAVSSHRSHLPPASKPSRVACSSHPLYPEELRRPRSPVGNLARTAPPPSCGVALRASLHPAMHTTTTTTTTPPPLKLTKAPNWHVIGSLYFPLALSLLKKKITKE